MKKNTQFILTEWNWFKIKLQLYSLETKGEMYNVYFEFESEEEKVFCMIYARHVQKMIEQKANKNEQLKYYTDWVNREKRKIAEILDEIPELRKELNLEKDFIFKIMYHYGMGGSIICEFIGKSIVWKKD